ncbi:hypothetical protein ACSFA2_16660 [Variovorax sp. LT2P21]|uniref:hypothetical protein n=1 Tax=Variovorax sp. LT2P21 TaxID=3443731 RepID=UPI003F47E0B5
MKADQVIAGNVLSFPTSKRVARRKKGTTSAVVMQIATAANKKQRCEAAAALHRDDCQRAVSNAFARTVHEPITGVIVVTATDLEGGDFNVRHAGIYIDDPEAALSTLGCLVKYYEEIALEARNARAMAKAQPIEQGRVTKRSPEVEPGMTLGAPS